MNAIGNNVDAIDLTLSSSPEPQPKPSQQRRPQVQHHSKKESRQYSMASKHSQVGLPGSAVPSKMPQRQTHAINPQHLRQIVYTSDETALRKVLLHLCGLSPALSGAVARGLAPHSTFARQVAHRRRTTAAHFKLENDGNDSAYERTKKSLVSESTSSKSPTRLHNTPNNDALVRRESQAATSQYSIRKVKEESSWPFCGPSATDSDETRPPGAYPRGAKRVVSITSPMLSTPKKAVNVNRTPLTSQTSAGPSNAQRKLFKDVCANCCLSFKSDSDDVCMYHIGQEVHRDGQGVYSCCDAPFTDPGCQFGCHISAGRSQQATNDRKRPSASPHPPGAERKRAKGL
ncbi:hypothetical protein T440DRAFT_216815 [Plenodomus tracheiphilus IPT5]|uniref:Uncharacterized protein n=1 Tax=Plenodomus tracheiphilus IPT5 TaxID=1408161 RepID=A0A6A7AYA9_9PLEO|nr:hypothetical protein T440DRAFT_216815 [Plenodomus tracheiphilus IPT5]